MEQTYVNQSIKTNTKNFYILQATMPEEPILCANSKATTAEAQIITAQSPEEFYQQVEK